MCVVQAMTLLLGPLAHIPRPEIVKLMHFDNCRSTENLWEKAVETLSDEDKQHIDFNRKDKLAVLDDVLAAVNDKKRLFTEKRWKYKKGNKEIIIRDKLEKLVVWVNKFKEVGDAAVQYDPGHASLPWAVVRFILQVPKLFYVL
jgi:hypothetical protein